MSRSLACSLFFALVASACGRGRNTDTTPELAYPTESSFCTALASAECNDAVVQACYGSDETTLEDDRARCSTAREAQCNPKKLPYHPEQAEPCLDAREAGLADAVWTHAELDAVDAACSPVFSKAGPDGAVCKTKDDCDTTLGLDCIVKLGSLQGVCGAPKVVGGGEDCTDPVNVCGPGFYCDPKVSHCLAQPQENDACSDAAPCASDFYCTASDAGTCELKTKNGLKCAEDRLCAGGYCLGATEEMEGICSSTLPLQITSATCAPYRE
jgi:hypothetical protein